MEYASRHLDWTPAPFFLPRFRLSSPSTWPLLNHAAAALRPCLPSSPSASPSSRATATLPRSNSGRVLVSDGVLVNPASGPVVWVFFFVFFFDFFFPVPHITGRALALCTLQEFGLAEHQALTTSSRALARASTGPDKPAEPCAQRAFVNLLKHTHVLQMRRPVAHALTQDHPTAAFS